MWVVLAAATLAPAVVRGQDYSGRVYIVAHGDTVSTVAQRLGVTTHALAERNHLAPPFALRVGRTLRLPRGVDPDIARRLPLPDGTVPAEPSPRRGRQSNVTHNWGRPRRPGVVQLTREYNSETLSVNLRRPSRHVRRQMERFLRFGDGRSHPIEVRLLRLLSVVSDHFGGRRLHVISGFRPFRHGQYTRHSNHNIGAAIDFRVDGVGNRVLREFCRTLENTGCGFYPRSVFVHMDVRERSTVWVDWSRPGQRPIYGREDRPPEATAAGHPATASGDGDADESVEDVAEDNAHVRDQRPAPDDDDSPESEATPAASASGAP